MYPVDTPEVIIHKRVYDNPLATARLERMMKCIKADRVTEATDDAELAALALERGWDNVSGRTGSHHLVRDPVIVFNTYQWISEEQRGALIGEHPILGRAMLSGTHAWTLRDHREIMDNMDSVCQSAWEIHCAFGCLHACQYCHVYPWFDIMLNLEELAEKIHEFGETIPYQNLYKFDNYTDTPALEPEYGASDVMVRMFAEWENRYLLLYTKSDNVDHLLDLPHNGKTIVSWSLSSDFVSREIEDKTPPMDDRIAAMVKCEKAGYAVRARISPTTPVKGWEQGYAELIEKLLTQVQPDVISLDVIGWMTPAMMKDALDTSLLDDDFLAELNRLEAEGFKPRGKHLFSHGMRARILRHLIAEIRKHRPDQSLSICVETVEMWKELKPLLGEMTPGDYACVCGPTCVAGHRLLSVGR